PRLDAYFQTEVCSGLMPGPDGTNINNPASCTPSYELQNFRLTYTPPAEDWRGPLGATNLTDEEYLLNIFDLTAFGQPFRQAQPGRPRVWYMSFHKTFSPRTRAPVTSRRGTCARSGAGRPAASRPRRSAA